MTGWLSSVLSRRKQPVAQTENWTVVENGLDYGEAWTRNKEADGAERIADLAWLAGFFSGLSLSENHNFLSSRRFEEVTLWMDNYCADHPADQICHGAQKIAAELLRPVA